MNRVGRVLLLCALAVIVLMVAGGCTYLMNLQSEGQIRDEMLAHLSSKYNGQKFVGLALESSYGTFYLHCYPEGGDPEADNVQVSRKIVDGVKEYRDSYFGIIIREDFEADVKSICSDIDAPMKVYDYQQYFRDNMWDGTKTYADFKRWIADGNPQSFSTVVILFLDDLDKGEVYANQIIDTLEKVDFGGSVSVHILPSVEYQQDIRALSWLNELLEKHDAPNVRKSIFRRDEAKE